MGTPQFAAVGLEKILSCNHNDYNIKAVFTPNDKPTGRGYNIKPSPVKQLALKYGLTVYQFQDLRGQESIDVIKKINPDVIVVIAYGVILPKEVLEIPVYGCINVHASLLPKYRGAGPVQWSIINGEKYTGVTTMFMDEGLDTGDIIFQDKILIGNNETSGELMERLAVLGSETLLKTLEMMKSGNIIRLPQNNDEATWAPMLNKSVAFIDFKKSAIEIHNLIRGINPWPIAKIKFNGKMLKIYKSEVIDEKTVENKKPGQIVDNKKFIVACGKGYIKLLEVQLEGGKRMNGEDFLRGHPIRSGNIIN